MVPVVALAAVLIAAVARIVDIPAVVRLARVRPAEAAIAVVTLTTVVALGTLEGILAAVGFSLLDAARRRMHRGAGAPASNGPVEPVGAALEQVGPLFYGNAERFARDVSDVADRHAQTTSVVVDARRLTDIDATAADTLRQLAQELERSGKALHLADPPPDVVDLLDRYGLSALPLDSASPDRELGPAVSESAGR